MLLKWLCLMKLIWPMKGYEMGQRDQEGLECLKGPWPFRIRWAYMWTIAAVLMGLKGLWFNEIRRPLDQVLGSGQ